MSSRLGGMWSWFARACGISAIALVTVAVMASPAAAGGSWLSPVRDRYEPGDTATLVGYVGGGGSLGSVEDGPFFAYLRRLEVPVPAPNGMELAPFVPRPSDIPLGRLVVENRGRTDYTAYRVSIQFRLPSDLPPGRYGVIYCNATCTKGLSDLIGGVVFVGRDPEAPISRTWPPDEPEIANLAGDAVLNGPGWQTTAGEVRGASPGPPAVSTPDRPAPGETTARDARAPRSALDRNFVAPDIPIWVLATLSIVAVLGAGGLVALARARSTR
jgi:hypothetical protein